MVGSVCFPLSLLGWIRGSTKAFVNQKELAYTKHTHNLDSLSGVLSVTKGGTGVNNLNQLKNILGISESIRINNGLLSSATINTGLSTILLLITCHTNLYGYSIIGFSTPICSYSWYISQAGTSGNYNINIATETNYVSFDNGEFTIISGIQNTSDWQIRQFYVAIGI